MRNATWLIWALVGKGYSGSRSAARREDLPKAASLAWYNGLCDWIPRVNSKMNKKTEVKPKVRSTLAKDFQGEFLHKAGTAVAIGCEVDSKDIGKFILTIPDPVSLFLNKAESLIESAQDLKRKIITQQKYKRPKPELYHGCLQSSMGAYIFLVAAIESFLNIMIPPGFVYKHHKKGDLDKTGMQRNLNMYEKIDVIVAECKSSIKSDTVIWSSVCKLLDTRNEIVHLKDLNPVEQGLVFSTIFDTNFEVSLENIKKFIFSINPKYFI